MTACVDQLTDFYKKQFGFVSYKNIENFLSDFILWLNRMIMAPPSKILLLFSLQVAYMNYITCGLYGSIYVRIIHVTDVISMVVLPSELLKPEIKQSLGYGTRSCCCHQ